MTYLPYHFKYQWSIGILIEKQNDGIPALIISEMKFIHKSYFTNTTILGFKRGINFLAFE